MPDSDELTVAKNKISGDVGLFKLSAMVDYASRKPGVYERIEIAPVYEVGIECSPDELREHISKKIVYLRNTASMLELIETKIK